jgi:SAM-dependent methyltransferase
MIRCPACAQTYSVDKEACPKCGFSPATIAGFDSWAPELARGGGGFKAEYFANLATLEAGSFWFRARNCLIVWALRKYFSRFSSFLEIGCGTGFVLSGIAKAFPSARVVGSEVFSEGLIFAAERVPAGGFVQMDARRIPYEEEFDVVGAFDVLEHIAEDEVVLAQMYRAAKPGGGLLLTVPQHQGLWSSADVYACHVRRYSSAELHLKIRRAGFEIVRSTSFVTFLLPAMWISRRRNSANKTFDPAAEFCLPSMVNRAFELVVRFEHVLMQIGLSLPIGGSRLVVGRKPLPGAVGVRPHTG